MVVGVCWVSMVLMGNRLLVLYWKVLLVMFDRLCLLVMVLWWMKNSLCIGLFFGWIIVLFGVK